MRRYAFSTLDVFTDQRFGGNQLAVLSDARGLLDSEMQAIAAEFNLSETAFILPPADPANSACVRIFHRTRELPFAGHPTLGAAFVLATLGRDRDGLLVLEQRAGIVHVQIDRGLDGRPVGGTVRAPQPLTLGLLLPPPIVAECAGIALDDLVVTNHAPVWASTGNPYVIAEVTREGLSRATPDLSAFRRALEAYPTLAGRLSLHLYAHDGSELRARMFAPAAGTFEDAATGSANAPLGALLLSLSDAPTRAFIIHQGVEMGRPSRLHVTATRTADGIVATVGGNCVEVMVGEIMLA